MNRNSFINYCKNHYVFEIDMMDEHYCVSTEDIVSVDEDGVVIFWNIYNSSNIKINYNNIHGMKK